MKVLVIDSMTPFVHGDAEELADHLVRNLNLHGAEAELLRIPFRSEPEERLLEEMIICSNLKIVNVDRVIALRFPAYLIPFPRKSSDFQSSPGPLASFLRSRYEVFGRRTYC